MGFKQPRVPEYQRGESVETYIRTLILFLKDFCQEAWTENRTQGKGIDGIRKDMDEISYPVTSVNGKYGDVNLVTNDIAYLGTNLIGSDADDTTQNWGTIGSGYAWFDPESKWTSKPSAWGILVNAAYGSNMFQIWNAQPGGATYFRSGNGSGWSNGWRKIYDSAYKPTALEIGAYPIGSIYMSVEATSPASLFGGTWEQIHDRFLLAAGSTYAAGTTGGEAAVTLTSGQIPAFSGTAAFRSGANPGGFRPTGIFSTASASYSSLSLTSTSSSATEQVLKVSFGGGKAHNNMPPYLVVYMWKRVS